MISFLIFAVTLSVYMYSIHPSVPGGDAGELLSEACLLGTAHPPGYPLLIVTSWLNFLPRYHIFHTAAGRVNFLCCLMGAGSGAILYQIIYSYLQLENDTFDLSQLINVSSAVMGSILFCFSPLCLEYHTAAEVFALNNLLVSLILYQTIRIHKAGTVKATRRESIMGAFYAGLALTNQHTSVLYIVPVIVYVLFILSQRTDTGFGTLTLKLSLSFASGLSPYIYLVVSSWYPSPGSWGDMTTLQGFMRHVLRSEYGTFSLSPGQRFNSVENSFTRWKAYFLNTKEQFTHLGVGLFTIGFICSLHGGRSHSKQSSLTCVTIVTFIFYLSIWNGLFSNVPLSNPMAFEVHARFWIQPNIIYCLWMGVGSKVLLSLFFRHVQMSKVTALCFLSFIMVSAVSISSSRGISTALQSKSKMIIYDYAKAILNTLPKRSLLLSHSDLNWNSVRYLQTCESMRTDVSHISIQLLPFPWFQRQINAGLYPNVIFPEILPNVSTGRLETGNAVLITRFLRANLATGIFPGGLYMEMQSIADSDIGTNGLYRGEFSLLPWGLVYRVLPTLLTPKTELPQKWYPQSLKYTHLARNQLKEYAKIEFRQGSWEHAAISVFWDMHYQLGIHLLSFALYLSNYLKDELNLIPRYAQSLKDASKLLHQVHRVVNKSHATSYPYHDIIKNTALAHMRFYEFLQILPKLEKSVPNLPETSVDNRKMIFNRTKLAVYEYLTHTSSKDKDYHIFQSFYNFTMMTSP